MSASKLPEPMSDERLAEIRHILRNEDEHRCNAAEDDLTLDFGQDEFGEPRPCVLVPLSYDTDVALAALAAHDAEAQT